MTAEAVGGAGPRMLVVGAGGIGGTVSAYLLEQGHDVTVLTTNPTIAGALQEHGFCVRGESAPTVVRGRVLTELPADEAPFDYVLLATQPPQVEEAAERAAPYLAETGALVCFQNGLCEERVERFVGGHRVIGAVVAWGASMVEPGVYDRTSAGGFSVGRLVPSAEPDTGLMTLSHLLEAIGPTTTTENLRGARWSKLAINCAISSIGTLGGDRLGVLMRHRHVRRLALDIMTEVVEVARRLDVRLEKVSGTLDLDWMALTPQERVARGGAGLVAKHALLLAVGARYRRLRSSMLSAIERGRPPAVPFLNGEVVDRGRALGVPTPVNEMIQQRVLDIAAGRRRSSVDETRALYRDTR